MKNSNSDGLDEIIQNMCMHSQKDANGVVTLIYEGLSPDQAKQQLTAYINEVLESVIGEDEYVVPGLFIDPKYKRDPATRNKLRAEQRTKAKKLMGEG